MILNYSHGCGCCCYCCNCGHCDCYAHYDDMIKKKKKSLKYTVKNQKILMIHSLNEDKKTLAKVLNNECGLVVVA